jgi:hypothetical protein
MFEQGKSLFDYYMTQIAKETGAINAGDPDVHVEWKMIFESMEYDIRKLIKEELDSRGL